MESPLKVAICEDSKDEIEKLLKLIASSSTPAECEVYSCGEDFLDAFLPGKYDLILMDIYMTGMDGIETIQRVREYDREIPVAFVTTSLDHTLESYRLSALKYIEKPYQQQDIDDIFQTAMRQRNNSHMLIVKKGMEFKKIRLAKIVYLEQSARQVFIHLSDGSVIVVYDKLSNLLSQIDVDYFFHCHKSYAVNLSFVENVDSTLRCFVMNSFENVPIRRESLHEAKEVFEDFLFNSVRR